VTTLDFIHPSGTVTLTEVEARIVDEQLEVRGLIDNPTWERLQRHDIFGSSNRSRSSGTLPPGDALRITITTRQTLSTEAEDLQADSFVILDAMRAVDATELRAAGLEGKVWEGVRFGEPQPWAAAVTQLVAAGFEVVSTDNATTILVHDGDIATVEFRHRSDAHLVQIVVKSPLPLTETPPCALYEAINGINRLVPWSTTLIDGHDVAVRETIIDDVVDQPSVLAARVHDMLGLLWVMRDPLHRVANGTLTGQGGLDAMFG
jgi:hypothetical protein